MANLHCDHVSVASMIEDQSKGMVVVAILIVSHILDCIMGESDHEVDCKPGRIQCLPTSAKLML